MKATVLLMIFIPSLPFLVEVEATSFKMDFLSSGTVRTDPLMLSKLGPDCLSDHVHRFYGATSTRTMRPDVSYEDLRTAPGNTGNVEENKSLYWNPAIYKVKNPSGNKIFEIVDVWFASAYYIWTTGQATAFPNGLKMKASDVEEVARVRAICDGSHTCERDDTGGCDGYGPSNQTQHGFLPVTGCAELEMNIKFPTCWDGVNVEAQGDTKHVVYAPECDGQEHNECFDLDCPASHPVKMPELHLYVRVNDYEGGAHMFSDGSDIFHSDYFSGWDEKKLQNVLDKCDNPSEAANPNAFCSDFLTFRGKGKTEGVQVDDFDIVKDLKKIQPSPIDTKAVISPEDVTNISEIPRGSCTGTLLPDTSTTPAPTAAPSPVTGVTTCAAKGKTRKTVKVKKGESYTFNTNKAAKYGANVRCTVAYRRTKTCKKMTISCSQFSLAAGDMVRVARGKNKQMFKGSKGPVLSTSGNNITVFFKSNKKKHGAGATCTVACAN